MTKSLSPGSFNAFIILSVVLHYIFPIKIILHPPYTYLGLVALSFGLGINLWAVNQLKEEKTALEFHDTPEKLVTAGPFRISRNPIYLGGVILLLGTALLLGSIITFVFPILLFLILNGYYIPDEEKRLMSIFSEDYLAYKQKVRRWL